MGCFFIFGWGATLNLPRNRSATEMESKAIAIKNGLHMNNNTMVLPMQGSALDQFLLATGGMERRETVSVITSTPNPHYNPNAAKGGGNPEIIRVHYQYDPYTGLCQRERKSGEGKWVEDYLYAPVPLEQLYKADSARNGIFFRPNNVRHTNDTWLLSSAVFIEWDDLPLAQQYDKIQQLRDWGLAPTAIVHSGSKSLHTYLAIEPTLDPLDWLRVMSKLSVAMAGDANIVTLHREMRLPGGFRFKDGQWHEQALLEVNPGNRYTLEQIEAVLDATGLFPLGLEWERRFDGSCGSERFSRYKSLKSRGGDPMAALTHDFEQERLEREAKRQQLLSSGFNQDDPALQKRLVLENLRYIPSQWGTPGNGTYEAERNFAWAMASVLGRSETESILGALWSQRNVRQWLGAADRGYESGGVGHIINVYKSQGFDASGWYRENGPHRDTVVPLQRKQSGDEHLTQEDGNVVVSFDYAEKLKQEWLSRKTFTPDEVVNERYLSEIPEDRGHIAIKSPMGTGKTYQIAKLCARWGFGVLILGARNGLLGQLVGRANEIIEEHLKKISFIHGDADHWQLRDTYGRIAMCLDSILKLDPSALENKMIIIDELESVLRHLLTGGTINSRRRAILARFELILKMCSLVVVMDANLSDFSVAYLERLIGGKFLRIQNNHPGKKLNVNVMVPEKHRDKSAIHGEAMQALRDGHKISFVSDSQRELEAFDECASNEGFRVLRIDSKTMTDREFRKIAMDPRLGQSLTEMGVDAVLISPSGESGIDITTDGYFTKGYASFFGVLDSNTQAQIMRRVREITDWKVECTEFTTHETISGPRSALVKHLLSLGVEAAEAELVAAGADQYVDQVLADMTSGEHYTQKTGYQASRNYEMSRTRQCLIDTLEAQGHNVTVTACSTDEQAKVIMKAAKEGIIDKDAQKLKDAKSNMTTAEAARKLQSYNCTLDERFQAQRVMLLSRIPGIEETDLWTFELVREIAFTKKGLLSKLERYWLAQNIDIATNRATAKVKSMLDGFTWSADLVPYLATLQFVLSLGLFALIGDGKYYTDESPEVKDAFARAKRSRRAKALGLAPAPGDTPIAWASRILRKLFAIGTDKVHLGEGKKRTAFLEPQHTDLLPFIAAHMTEAFAENCKAKWPQTQTQQGVGNDQVISNSITNSSTADPSPQVDLQNLATIPGVTVHIGGYEWLLGMHNSGNEALDAVCWVGADPSQTQNWRLRVEIEAQFNARSA